MDCFFIFNNLKVSPFVLSDKPLNGFQLAAWDSWTLGTLWSIKGAEDAGFTTIGISEVHGQLWANTEPSRIKVLENCFGVQKGLTLPVDIEIVIKLNGARRRTVPAKTFALTSLSPDYQLIQCGKWRF